MSESRGPKPLEIQLSEKQQRILEEVVNRRHSPRYEVVRGSIILKANSGRRNQHIADELGIGRPMVWLWRKRWAESAKQLERIEAEKDDRELRSFIQSILADAPRSGCPATFTPERICRIVAVACEPPEDSQRPIPEWTNRELADEVIKRNIVSSISVRSVGRFLKRGRFTATQIRVLAQQRKRQGSREVRWASGGGVSDLQASSGAQESGSSCGKHG